jgi:phosphohistidine phosphatase
MSKIVYLLRHAKAEQSPADAPTNDHDRPLTPRGQNAAKLMAHALVAQLANVGRVYCSTSRRTRETYGLIKDALDQTPVSFRESLYLAPADDLMAFVQGLPEKLKSIMIIGHNPGLHDLSLQLTARAGHGQARKLEKLRTKFPTGALSVLTFDVPTWSKIDTGIGTLVAFIRPRDLAGKSSK